MSKRYKIFTKKNIGVIIVNEETYKTIAGYKRNNVNTWIETSDWSGNTEDIIELNKGETAEYREKKRQEGIDIEKEKNQKYYEEENNKFNSLKKEKKNRSIEEKSNDLRVAKYLLS